MVGRPREFLSPVAEVDLRVGGKYRLGMLEPGKDAPYVCHGVYQEIDPPTKLVFTWAWESQPDHLDFEPVETLVTIDLVDKNGATEVTLTHERFPDAHMRDEHEDGWIGCLDSLNRLFS